LHFGRILADESCAGRHGSIHADSRVIGAVPLSPAIFFRRLRALVSVPLTG
jgi:hypothetical protein